MKRNLILVIIANIVYLIINLGTNFILPKFTSVETYAMVKEYTLYITTYAGLLTFGYIQGMYLKYGGKELTKISKEELGTNFFSFLIFMIPISIITSLIGVFFKNTVIMILGAGILACNLLGYYQHLYQATGDFKDYSLALNLSRAIVFISYIVFVFVLKTDKSALFIIVSPLSELLAVSIITFRINKKIAFIKFSKIRLSEIYHNIKDGFILMTGNFVTNFFSTIDRWFVKLLMPIFSFAVYSFAVSMENVVNTFMNPITVSMYNYFCKEDSQEKIRKLKDSVFIYAFVVIALAFPAKLFLELFIQKYIDAVSIIFPLFAAQGISTIIKGIYVNKYKAEKKQKKYLIQMLIMLALGIGLNIVGYLIFKRIEAFAFATLLTNLIWLVICEIQTPEYRFSGKAIVSMILLLTSFILCGYCMNSILGCVSYLMVGLLLGLTLMRDSFLFVIKSVFQAIKNNLKCKNNDSETEK